MCGANGAVHPVPCRRLALLDLNRSETIPARYGLTCTVEDELEAEAEESTSHTYDPADESRSPKAIASKAGNRGSKPIRNDQFIIFQIIDTLCKLLTKLDAIALS